MATATTHLNRPRVLRWVTVALPIALLALSTAASLRWPSEVTDAFWAQLGGGASALLFAVGAFVGMILVAGGLRALLRSRTLGRAER